MKLSEFEASLVGFQNKFQASRSYKVRFCFKKQEGNRVCGEDLIEVGQSASSYPSWQESDRATGGSTLGTFSPEP